MDKHRYNWGARLLRACYRAARADKQTGRNEDGAQDIALACVVARQGGRYLRPNSGIARNKRIAEQRHKAALERSAQSQLPSAYRGRAGMPIVVGNYHASELDLPQLSQLQRDVCELLASGNSLRECAAILNITLHTVRRVVAGLREILEGARTS